MAASGDGGYGAWPAWWVLLRALREARGLAREGWAARLGYSPKTVQRWELGQSVPTAAAEAALLALCTEEQLFQPYTSGPLRGLSLTPAGLRSQLAAARLAGRARDYTFPERALTVLKQPTPPRFSAPSAALPVPLTSFVGRVSEHAAVMRLLRAHRLVTLSGPGGSGKTRLAIQVAATMQESLPDGVAFVDLAPITDAALVPLTVAHALKVQEHTDVSLHETLATLLRSAELVLVLDNAEHVLGAADFIAFLLQAAPRVRILTTSRAPLRIPGEWEYAVPPLPLPPDTTPGRLAENPAVQLFVARAQAVRHDFELTEENSTAVAAICARLDGLPLAIELAATRVRALPPAALLPRLEHRLALLVGGARTAPVRQRTLRDTIAWSYTLLTPAEQQLFRRLGVFAGGFTLELAESVAMTCSEPALPIVDGVGSLVEQSLLGVQTGAAGSPRYRMLETIREFALERLAASQEARAVHAAHAGTVVSMAEAAGESLTGPTWAQGRWQLEAERHNLRAAYAWAVANRHTELALRLTGALWLWLYTAEGAERSLQWAEQALGLPDAITFPASRAAALRTLGFVQFVRGDYRAGAIALREAVALLRTLDRPRDLGLALTQLASNYHPASGTAARLLEESLALAAETRDTWARAFALRWQSIHARGRGEYGLARAAAAACLAAAQAVQEPALLTAAWTEVAAIALGESDPSAGAVMAQALDAARAWGVDGGAASALLAIAGCQTLQEQRPAEAEAIAREGLQRVAACGLRNGPDVSLLAVLACAWTAQGYRAVEAARLLGAIASHTLTPTVDGRQRLSVLVGQSARTLREALGETAFAGAYAAGRAMTRDAAIAEVLSGVM